MSIQWIFSNCSPFFPLLLFFQLALLCSFFFCVVFSNVVMFSPQDMYKYRAPVCVCIIRFQPVFLFFFLRVCEELGFLCAQNTIRAWNVTNCPFCGVRMCLRRVSQKSIVCFLVIIQDTVVFGGVISAWVCCYIFLFYLNFAPNICFVLILWWHFSVVLQIGIQF